MYRAFTLIEILISFTILIIAAYFIFPIIFRLQDNILLANEIDHIQSFIYQIQAKARYTKQNYSLTINQKSADKWCMVAVPKAKNSKKETACDCFNLTYCIKNEKYYFYQNKTQSNLYVNHLYPKVFMNIDGLAAQLESKCLAIERNDQRKILQFYQYGVINVLSANQRSQCK